MYERMLDKKITPSIEEMAKFCGENSERFSSLNDWLAKSFDTEQKIVFPYGNNYGWGVAHKKKGKLMCNVFAEKIAAITHTQDSLPKEALKDKRTEIIDMLRRSCELEELALSYIQKAAANLQK